MKRNIFLAFLLFWMGLFTASAHTVEEHARIPAHGFAVMAEGGEFQPYTFSRHAVGDNEIQIEILYAGICHSDLHHVASDWGKEEYPLVPGHEIVGRVVKIGKNVTKFKVGDIAGVGCLVNACGECEFCLMGLEQYCPNRVLTYHDHDKYHDNEQTQGGYSDTLVVSQNFAIKVPENADIEKIAPLLCAGITTWSPIHYMNVKKGDKIGIAGFGGLGHMAVKYAVALGAEVTVFDITEAKREDAKRMGAVRYVNVTNPEELNGLDNSLNYVLSTVPAKYDPAMYMKMLKINGQMAIVGLPAIKNMPSISVLSFVIHGNRKVFGSQIGGIKETQEMLDYSVAHNLYPEVEVIKADAAAINEAYKKVQAGEVKFRYVIDMKTLKHAD
ncbi:MAG: NAD(P)-dependent alcohol dehydrogenase [Oxalobacter sp.]|nr:NAD(P)-dependent alcohol dehydrogenase [Oxalobacter sp.]